MPRTTRSDPTAKLVGQAIRRARHDAGLTQAQLARRLATTTPYVTNVEAGRTNLTVGQLASIADALNAILDVNLCVLGEERLVVQRTERHGRSRIGPADDIKHFLVTRDVTRRKTTVGELGTDYEAAQRAYQEAERQARRRSDLDVVLLSADSLETIKLTHSSYFEPRSLDELLPA